MPCFTLNALIIFKKYSLSICVISPNPLPGGSYSSHFASEDTGFGEVALADSAGCTTLSGGAKTGSKAALAPIHYNSQRCARRRCGLQQERAFFP